MAPQSKKPIITIKLTPGKMKQIQSALDMLYELYFPLLVAWGQLTPRQRDEVLAHSPLLATLLALTAPAREERYA